MNVLLLDTAFAAAPIYDYLVRCGHDVWVMGNRPNDLLAKRAGPRWIDQDYSKHSAVRDHVLRHDIEYVVPGCTDVSMETCLQLQMNSHLVDSAKTNFVLSNKAAFRDLCDRLHLPAPRTVAAYEFPLQGTFICKPVDAFSGRGITVFNGSDRSALEAALQTAVTASPTSTALIETFAVGDLYSCSAFVENERLTDAFYVFEGSSANPFAVDTSYVVYDLPSSCTQELEESLNKMCAALRLKDGLLHTQFIMAEGRALIIEVARRCPGDLYSLLIEFSTGFEYAAKYASYFIGSSKETQSIVRKHVLRHTVSALEDSIFGGLRFVQPVTTRAFFSLQIMGQELVARQGTRSGILFCETLSHELLLGLYRTFVSRGAYHLT